MRNGTQSNKLRLVDHTGDSISDDSGIVDIWYQNPTTERANSSTDSPGVEDVLSNKWLFVIVSATCAMAAVAAGTYAAWLSRRRVAEDALENVQDILQTCQDRMRSMEMDLASLPLRTSASPTA